MDVKIIDTSELMASSAVLALEETSVLNLSTEGAVEGLLSSVNATKEQVMIGYLENGQIVMRANAAEALPKDGATHQAQLCTTNDGELMVVFYSDQDGTATQAEPATSEASGTEQQLVKVQYGAIGTDDYSLQSFYMPVEELGQTGVNLMSGDLPRASSNDANVLASLIESGAAVPIQPVGMKNEINVDAHLIQTEDGFQCSVCPVKTRRLPDAKSHIRTHTGEKPYECNHCKKRFARADYLTHHLRTHTGKKPYQCRECNRSFAQKVNLNRHIQLHTQEKPYSCAVCSARFARKFYLSNHMNLHLNIKPYRCILCKRKFNQLSSLQGHIARHRHDKRYSCELCVRRFYRRAGVVKHMKLHEDARTCMFCPKCGKASVTASSANRHLASCRGVIHFCKHCYQYFDNLEEYQGHVDALIAECKKTDTGDRPGMLLDDIDSDNFSDTDGENVNNNKSGDDAEEAEMSNLVGKVMAMSDIAEKTVPDTDVEQNLEFHGKVMGDGCVDGENIDTGSSRIGSKLNSIGKIMALSDIAGAVGIGPGVEVTDPNLVSGLGHVEQTVTSVENDANNPLYNFVHSVLGAEAPSIMIDDDGTQHIVIEMQPESVVGVSQTPLNDVNKLVHIAHQSDHQFAIGMKNASDGLCIDEKPSKQDKSQHRCDVCEKTYSRRDNLLCHMRIHNGVKPHKCPHCEVSFVHKGNLNKHLKTHSSDRPYVCDVCSKAFSRSTYLKNHQRIHTGEKPYKCDICLKVFRLASVLSKHSLIHKNIRPHACSQCGKMFRTKGNCRVHEDKQHSKDVAFLCSTCKKHCRTKEALIIHCQERHGMAVAAPGEDPMKFVVASDHGKVVLKQTTKPCTPGLDNLLSNLDAGMSSEDEDAIRLRGADVPGSVEIPGQGKGNKGKKSGRRRRRKENGSTGQGDQDLNAKGVACKKTYKMVKDADGNIGCQNADDAVETGNVESCSTIGKSWSAQMALLEETGATYKGAKSIGKDGQVVETVNAATKTPTKRKRRGKVFTDFDLGGESEEEADDERTNAASNSTAGMTGKKMKLLKLRENNRNATTSAPVTYMYVSESKTRTSAADSISFENRNDNIDDVAEILAQISEIPVVAAPSVTDSASTLCVPTTVSAVSFHSGTDLNVPQAAPVMLECTCDPGTTVTAPSFGDSGVAMAPEVENVAYTVVQENRDFIMVDISDEVSVTAS